jgi:SAM-dependent methyltransferase
MPQADADRWNARYRVERAGYTPHPQDALLAYAQYLPVTGRVLDLAMGLGGSAGWLAARGFRVVGVDLSEVAVQRAHARYPKIETCVADCTQLAFSENSFDVILNFYYLDRNLWPVFSKWLVPGGLLIFETMNVDILALKPDIDPVYLLQPGELRAAFSNWDILDYYEGLLRDSRNMNRPIVRMAARQPGLL